MRRSQSPRELSKQFGYSSLDVEDLWSLILRFGTKKESVYSMSKQLVPILEQALESSSPTQILAPLIHNLSFGEAKVHTILAVYELLQRVRVEKHLHVKFTNPSQIVESFHFLNRKKQEYVYGIYLSPRFNIIHKELLTKGTTDSVLIDIRDIFYFAIKHRVRNFILLHNHPTGNPTPSCEDIEQTKRIVSAASLMSLTLVDHIIMGREGYFSFKESTSVL